MSLVRVVAGALDLTERAVVRFVAVVSLLCPSSILSSLCPRPIGTAGLLRAQFLLMYLTLQVGLVRLQPSTHPVNQKLLLHY